MAYMRRESKVFQSIFHATRIDSYRFEIRTVFRQTENYFLLYNFSTLKCFNVFETFFSPT